MRFAEGSGVRVAVWTIWTIWTIWTKWTSLIQFCPYSPYRPYQSIPPRALQSLRQIALLDALFKFDVFSQSDGNYWIIIPTPAGRFSHRY